MLRFLIITFVASAMAHHGGSHMGACPEVKPVENFNLSAVSFCFFFNFNFFYVFSFIAVP